MASILTGTFLPERSIPLALVGADGILLEPPGLVSESEGDQPVPVLREVARYRQTVRWTGVPEFPVGNLVPNPAFQPGSGGSITGWSVIATGSGRYRLDQNPILDRQVVIPDSEVGNYSYFILQDTGEHILDGTHRYLVLELGEDSQGSVTLTSQPFAVPAGVPLTLAIHYMTESGNAGWPDSMPDISVLLQSVDSDTGNVTSSWQFALRDKQYPNGLRLVRNGELVTNHPAQQRSLSPSIRRYVCSSCIVIPSGSEQAKLTFSISGQARFQMVLFSTVLFVSVAAMWYEDTQVGSYLFWHQSLFRKTGGERSLRLQFTDTPYHRAGIHAGTDSGKDYITISSMECYSVPLVSTSDTAQQVKNRLVSDTSIWSGSVTHYGDHYTGGYTWLDVEKVNGRTVRRVQIAAGYGTVLKAGFYTDTLPVLRGAGYSVTFPVLHPYVSPAQYSSFLSQFADIAKLGYSVDCARLVVQGLDVNDNVVEEPFVSPLYTLQLGGSSLIGYPYTVPNPKCPELVVFRDPATVKARIGIEFLQYYEYDPSDTTRPIYRVPYPHYYYLQGEAREYLALVDPGEYGTSVDLVQLSPAASPGLDTGWATVSAAGYLTGWTGDTSGRYTLTAPSAIYGELSDGIARSKLWIGSTSYFTHDLHFGISREVTIDSDLVYFVVDARIRVNLEAVASLLYSSADAVQLENLFRVYAAWALLDSDENARLIAYRPVDTDTLHYALYSGVMQYSKGRAQGEWFRLRSVCGANIGGRYGETLQLHFYLALSTIAMSKHPAGTIPTLPLFEVDDIHIYKVTTIPGATVQRELVPAGTVPVLVPDTVNVMPSVRGWEVSPSGDMRIRIRPGTTTEIRTFSGQDVSDAQSDPLAWVPKAVAENGWLDEPVVLIYRIPPEQMGLDSYVRDGSSIPVVLREERVSANGRWLQLSEPCIHLQVLVHGGNVYTIDKGYYPPSRQVQLDEDPPASQLIARYLAHTTDCVYSGYVSRAGQRIPLLVRRDGACLAYSEDSSGAPVLVSSEQFLSVQGATLILLPCAIALYDEQGAWMYQPDTWVYASRYLPQGTWLLQHRIGIFDRSELSSLQAPLVIGWITGISPISGQALTLLDLRRRGGGVQDAESLPAEMRNALWDVSDWDGAVRGGAGHVIVKLPAYLLDPNNPRGGYTEQQIRDIVRKYLPAGITFDIEFMGS